MSRQFLLFISTAWIVLIALACGLTRDWFEPKKLATAASPRTHLGKDVVSLWGGVILGRWDEPIMREVIDRFNQRSKDIYIDASLIPYASYVAKINLTIAIGDPPDVFPNALIVADGVRQRQGGIDLTVPIPDDMVTTEQRKRWSPAVIRAISRQGKMYLFPTQTYLTGETFGANLEYFEKAGVDIRKYLEQGWDYEEYKREMKKVQDAARRERGPEAYAYGINLKNMDSVLYSCLLPQVIGVEASSRSFLSFDKSQGRYVLDPVLTAEKLAEPMRFMQDMLNKDRLWGKRFLGMDFGQIVEEAFDRRMLVSTFQNTPGNSVSGQVLYNDQVRKGIKKKPLRLTTVPYPVPRKGLPLVFGVGADGWGVMRQIPDKGEKHVRHALEVARYMSSPEVLAAYYRVSGYRANPWPDNEAVLALAPDAPDPIKQDAWLGYLWDTYVRWLKSSPTFNPNDTDWPQPEVRKALLVEMDPFSSSGFLTAGEGHQILEAVLYGKKDPLEGARQILAGLTKVIDRYYAMYPDKIVKNGP